MKATALNLLKLAVTAVLLYMILRRIPLTQILSAAAGASPALLATALALNAVSRVVSAYQSSLLFRVFNIRFSTASIFRITLASGFYGFFLPGEVGSGLVKWYKLSHPQNIKAEALTVMFIAKLLSFFLTFALGFLGLAVENPFHSTPFNLLSAALFLLSSLLLLLVFSPLCGGWLKRRAGTGGRGGAGRVLRTAADLLSATRRLPRSKLSVLFLLTALIHAAGILSLYWLAASLSLGIPFVAIFWLNSVAVLALSLPFSLSGLGVREGAFLLLLKGYGVAGGHALAFSLLIFAVTVFFNLLGGVFEAGLHIPSRKGGGRTP